MRKTGGCLGANDSGHRRRFVERGAGWKQIEDYILGLANTASPRVCFIPTASGEVPQNIVRFYEVFTSDRCRPSHLTLINRKVADLRGFLLGQDVIYVGGGNTAAMLAIWRQHRVDEILREAWRQGTILCGSSAGGICWHDGGVTDSFGLPLQALNDGLGFIPGSFCPHYDAEATAPCVPTLHRRWTPSGRARGRQLRRRPLRRPGGGGDCGFDADRAGVARKCPRVSARARLCRGTWGRDLVTTTLEDVRAILEPLDGTEEGTSYGTSAFRARRKLLVRLREDGDTLVVCAVEEPERDMLIATRPEAFYTTPHYRGHPSVLVRLSQIEREELEGLLTESWRRLTEQKAPVRPR